MSANEAKTAWEEYRAREISEVTPLLTSQGYTLDPTQVHTAGERYLMAGAQDVGTGGKKLVLTARRTSTGERVLVKFSTTLKGRKEIERERASRALLHSLKFAQHAFTSPKELQYESEHRFTLYITEFIEEERTLMEHPLNEQFFYALRALETQEGVHATTFAHAATIEEAFGLVDAQHYLTQFASFSSRARASDPDNRELAAVLDEATRTLTEHQTLIERYCGFLTHSDFSPQNLRIRHGRLYLLDYASLYFGNKYESWARFINFMTQHHPALEQMLLTYVRENRGRDEYQCLRLMQVYKLGFLLQFWTGSLAKCEGKLHELVRLRITFWTHALRAVLDDTPFPADEVRAYLAAQAELRSDEEKARQKEILAREQIAV